MPNKPIRFDFEADTDKYSRSVKDAAKDTEKLEKAIKDVPKATDKMADQADRDFDRLGDSAADAGKETAQEFRQNLGEGLASGNIEDLVSDTLGGLVASLSGPIGLAAAAIAGVGALAWNALRGKAEEETEAIKAMAGSLADSISSLYEQGVQTATKIQALDAFNQWIKDNTDSIKEMRDEADLAGVSIGQITAAAYEGGKPFQEMQETLYRIMQNHRDWNGELDDTGIAAQDIAKWMDQQAGTSKTVKDNQKLAADASAAMAESMGLTDTNMDGIIDAADKVNGKFSNLEATLGRIADTSIKIPVSFYTTGQGAQQGYLDPHSSGYSPGHVAIYNLNRKLEAGQAD